MLLNAVCNVYNTRSLWIKHFPVSPDEGNLYLDIIENSSFFSSSWKRKDERSFRLIFHSIFSKRSFYSPLFLIILGYFFRRDRGGIKAVKDGSPATRPIRDKRAQPNQPTNQPFPPSFLLSSISISRPLARITVI